MRGVGRVEGGGQGGCDRRIEQIGGGGGGRGGCERRIEGFVKIEKKYFFWGGGEGGGRVGLWGGGWSGWM